jgi:ABC-type oligopeptide transport system ATPase subunit
METQQSSQLQNNDDILLETFFSRDNFELNLENWNSGTILFITGISGSGKTTTSNFYRDTYKGPIEIFHMDVSLDLYKPKTEAITSLEKRLSDDSRDSSKYIVELFAEFAKTLPDDCFGLSELKDKSYEAYMTFWVNVSKQLFEFTKQVEPKLKKDTRYIFEGTQIFKGFDPDFFETRPLIIVNTGRLKAAFHDIKRELSKPQPFGKKATLIANVFKFMKYQKALDYKKDDFQRTIKADLKAPDPKEGKQHENNAWNPA